LRRQNTSNSTKEKFISPKPVEIYCNTHSPAEKSHPITDEPIPPPSDSPANQLQSNVTDTEPKPPTVSIPNFRPTILAQPYQSDSNPAYAPPADKNFAIQDKPKKKKLAEPAYKTLPPVQEPTTAEKVYNRSMDVPITITQRELISMSSENYHEMETEIAEIQPIYTAEHSYFTVKNTTDRSIFKENFISPVEIYCNTHKPAEKSDSITTEPIPPLSDSPATQLQSNVTKTDYNHSITDKLSKILPNTTENNRQSADYNNSFTNKRYIFLPNISEDNRQNSPTPETNDHITNTVTENTDDNREFTDNQLPTIKYLSTDIQLSNSQYLPTNDNTTNRIPIHSNINRPLKYQSSPANRIYRHPNVFTPDIIYFCLFTEIDKSPD